MNKKPINQPLNPNRPPIVPNAAPVVPGAPRDLGENARLKVLEDRLVPKNTKRIIKEIPDFDALLESDFVYISNDDSELRKIRAIKLNSAIEGLSYSAIYDASEEIEGSPAGHTLYLPAEHFNRVPIINEEVFLYVYIDNPADEYASAWASTAKIVDERLSSQAKKDIADDKDADNTAEILNDLDTVEVLILDGCIDILAGLSADIRRNLEAEIARAKAAEEQLADDISAETRARQEADAMLLQRLVDETQARQEADRQLNQKIDAEITAEKTARENADATLQANINTERTARENADNALDARVATIEHDYLKFSDKTELQTAITNEEAARIAADQAEVDRATTAEGGLSTAITNEATARAEAIAAETARAGAVEQGLAARLDNIGTGLQVANGDLTVLNNATVEGNLKVKGTTTTVDQETIQSQAQIIVTNSNNAAVIDQTGIVALKGTYTAYEVTAENYAANTFYYEYKPNKYQLDESETYTEGRQYYVADAEGIGLYKADEDALLLGEGIYYGGNFEFNEGQGQKIATRSDNLASGYLVQWDDTNHTLVDSGINAQTIAQQVEDVRQELGQEKTARQSADNTLQANINAEATRATGEEQRIEGKLDQEISDRQAAITQEVADRNTAINTAVSGEASLREQADNALQTNINTEIQAREVAISELKDYTDEKFKTDAFIVCTTDTEVDSYRTDSYVGSYIKFKGTSASGSYKDGYFYLITADSVVPAGNDWDTVNSAFESRRAELQSTSTTSTTISKEVLSKGRIDIKQDSNSNGGPSLTSPNSINANAGISEASNPRYQSNDRTMIYSSSGSGLGSASSYKRLKIAPGISGTDDWICHNTDNEIKLRCQNYRNPGVDTNDRSLTYNPGEANGVMYAMTTNWHASPKPLLRTSLEELATNIHGSHMLKVAADALSATARIDVQLFEMVDTLQVAGSADKYNEVIGSIWLKYTDISGNTTTAKVQEVSMSIPTSSIPSGTSSYTQTWDSTEKQTVSIELPLVNTLTESGYKNFEIIEVLENYKNLEGNPQLIQTDTNYLNVFAWAAFTDLRVLTTTSQKLPERIYATSEELDTKQDILTTASVSDGDIDKAIGFDNNGTIVKGKVTPFTYDAGTITKPNPGEHATVTIDEVTYNKLVSNPQAIIKVTCENQIYYLPKSTDAADENAAGTFTMTAINNTQYASVLATLLNFSGNYFIFIFVTENDIIDEAIADSANLITSGGVRTAINELDVDEISVGAANTLSSISEIDGKISATATPIQIVESQVTNLETDLANKVTLNTAQTITGNKQVNGTTQFNGSVSFNSRFATQFNDIALYRDHSIQAPNGGSGFAAFISHSSSDNNITIGSPKGNTGLAPGILKIKSKTQPTEDGTLDFGASAYRWKDLYLAGSLSDGVNSISVSEIANKQDTLTFATDTDIDDIFASVNLNEGDSISNDTLNLGNETSINQNGDTIIL